MRRHLLTGLLAAGVAVLLGVWTTPSPAAWDPLELFTPGEKVGVVEVTGLISSSTPILEQLKKFREDRSIRAIVLRVSSPGGAVAPSQEIMEEVIKTKKVKKVVASFGSMATSGGYYVACGADLIMASPGSATGSIGVIMQLANVEQLTKRLGLDFYSLKAGALKDMGSPFKPLTPEERAVFQSLLNNIHEQFIKDVAENRKLPIEKVRSLADGRVFTGQEAKALGLVDAMGNFNDAVERAGRLGGIKGRVEPVYPEKKGFSLLRLLLGQDVEKNLEFLTAPYPEPAFLPPWFR
jgi:protease-4|uniref:Signal peptide peptidase SppA n=1 Tax=Desulfobacca acetoxidans TaxID=60893 RepID=A0A7C3UZF4_9BACT